MGTCSNCGEVVNQHDMIDMLCIECQDPAKKEQRLNKINLTVENTSFSDHLFKKSWYFYIIAIMLGIGVSIFEIHLNKEFNYTLLQLIYYVLGFLVAITFKNQKFYKKLLMYFASSILIGITTALTIFCIELIFLKI